MKIKCKNNKRFNITLEKEYEVIREDDNFYIINNDSNKEVRYSKELFDVIPENTNYNLENIIITTDRIDNCRYTIRVNYLKDNQRINLHSFVIGNAVALSSTSISCGIYQLFGLNSICPILVQQVTPISNSLRAINVVFDESDIVNLISNTIFHKYLFSIIQSISTKFILASTNISNNSYFTDEQYSFDSVLTDLSSTTSTGRNPNSGNDIKLWVLNKG